MQNPEYLYTVDTASVALFLKECRECRGAQVTAQLEEGVFLVRVPGPFSPLFARHRFRINGAEPLDAIDNLPLLRLPAQGTIGFQLRADHRLSTSFREIADLWMRVLRLEPERINSRSPDYVASGYFSRSTSLTQMTLYYGLSPVTDNLSPWAGGFCRIPISKDALSRAEQKLLEAFELIGERLPESGLALDLGAAPGGWTRVAAQLGFQVHAVDPAKLHPSIADRPTVTHYQTTGGDFLKKTDNTYDLLLCDMKMEARFAADLVLECAPKLQTGAYLIMTLKLPKGEKALVAARGALKRLGKGFSILQARQLYFNRSEITVIAKKP